MIKTQENIVVSSAYAIFFGGIISVYASTPFNVLETKDCTIRKDARSQPMECHCQKIKSFKCFEKSESLVNLVNIESNDYQLNNIFSKINENIFFIESSGRNHLRPRDACAIESALLQNAGTGIFIIVAMTSPVLDILANNATCQLYTNYAAKNLYFRYVNVDTIFQGTPLNQFHIDGKLSNRETKHTTYQYR